MSKIDFNLSVIANSLPIGILIADDKGIIYFSNAEALKILDLDHENILSKNIFDIFLSFQKEDILKSNIKCTPSIIKYNGIDIIITIKNIVHDECIKGACLIFQKLDIYKEFIRQSDDEIESALLLKALMETTNDPIVYVNKEGFIELFSKAYAEFLEIKVEDAVGKHVTEIIENTRMHIVVKNGIPEYEEVQKIKGKKMIATRIPVFFNGKVVGAVGKVLFRDIDELKYLYQKVSKIEKELNLYKNEFKTVNKAKYNLNHIISNSKSMDELKEFTKKIAQSNSNVLILGESGTGKELFAHSIHNNSRRVNSPFIKVNCGAIPYELLESELFGYEEGSFTGAKKGGRIGKFKAADGGTIFLDEIGDLPMNMQVKLLRVIQDKEIEKIGSSHSESIDVRIIAATNKDLEKMVDEGMFRLDLYYRLNVVNIRIPPLRERKEDINTLSQYLIKKTSRREDIRVDGISDEALEYLKRYHWPGNVRELGNILERAINFLDKRLLLILNIYLVKLQE
ncbi:sigma 54-interacting transcriptional regulator [Clostridium sp. Cult1]|uniref:sigma 54-interacting transcriptional regulator n=1 Tax=Clostridium sp. Cult1 TaxID=2079002 RepID=UPI001F02941C|nr:sigma 54-interacting transcriptional regulator [Clostridium sp. Cult1]